MRFSWYRLTQVPRMSIVHSAGLLAYGEDSESRLSRDEKLNIHPTHLSNVIIFFPAGQPSSSELRSGDGLTDYFNKVIRLARRSSPLQFSGRGARGEGSYFSSVNRFVNTLPSTANLLK